jgi:uncharacterized membrane protein YccC
MLTALLSGFDALLAMVYYTLIGWLIVVFFVLFVLLYVLSKRLDREHKHAVDYERSA